MEQHNLLKGASEERQEKWAEARKQYRAAIRKEPFRFRGYARLLRALRM